MYPLYVTDVAKAAYKEYVVRSEQLPLCPVCLNHTQCRQEDRICPWPRFGRIRIRLLVEGLVCNHQKVHHRLWNVLQTEGKSGHTGLSLVVR